jgi:serine/threonine protein kinase
MTTKTPCPSVERLADLVAGRMAPDQVDELAQHLEACGHCVALIQSLPADTLANSLLTPPIAGTPADLIARIKGLANTPTGDDLATGSADRSSDFRDYLSAPQAPDEIGRLGSYRVLRELGQGGMGMVFEAEDTRLKRRVALKVMQPDIARNSKAKQRFVREAELAARITHDYIVTIYDIGEANNVPFVAMQLLVGESLHDRIRRERRLSIAEVLRIGRETAEGLAAAHAVGLIHRDIKPANLWMEAPGKPGANSMGRVKILDFGLARSADDTAHLTQSGAIVGTPAYMAPEQGRAKPVDARADLFSLGCVLYELCTGERAFPGADTMAILMSLAVDTPEAPNTIRSEVPAALSDFIMRLLEKDPAKRPGSAAEVVATLSAMERPDAIPMATPVAPTNPWADIDLPDEPATELTAKTPKGAQESETSPNRESSRGIIPRRRRGGRRRHHHHRPRQTGKGNRPH